jgi:phosphoribosylanthranilate isomerase
MRAAVKICGVTAPDAVTAAVKAGARYIGLNFIAASPRFLDLEKAKALSALIPSNVAQVALFADPADDTVDAVISALPAINLIQLHGNESPERVAAIKARFNRKIIKAIAIASAADLAGIKAYDHVVDHFLFDAKPPAGVSTLTGGHGLAFDWELLDGFQTRDKWFLAGGLNPGNVAEAIRLTGAPVVDVSSGVEDRPGHKDVAKIDAFLAAVKEA